MTWVQKLKFARKTFAEFTRVIEADATDETKQSALDLFRSLTLMTEAIEEIGHAAKTPLTDWDAPAP